jgi:hypothetical protein
MIWREKRTPLPVKILMGLIDLMPKLIETRSAFENPKMKILVLLKNLTETKYEYR